MKTIAPQYETLGKFLIVEQASADFLRLVASCQEALTPVPQVFKFLHAEQKTH